MNPKISVIVPIYKVEKYLPNCVESILNQSYTNLEIILVNDGSPDNCGKICDNYAEQDIRIQVIHKQNGGLSDARNAGFKASTGDYISFIDSDDYLDPDMYSCMMENVKTNDCEIVECAVVSIFGNTKRYPEVKDTEVLNGKEALTGYLKTDGNYIPRTAVWSKLFKRDIISDLTFPKGEIHEDYMFTVTAMYRAKKVAIIHKGLYFHLYTNPNSITNANFSLKDLYRVKQLKNIAELMRCKGSDEQYKYALANYYRGIIKYYYLCSGKYDDKAKEFRKILLEEKNTIIISKLPAKKRFEIILIRKIPRVYLICRHGFNMLRNT